MKRRRWEVWNDKDDTLFEGCKTKALAYYKRYGGERAGLHVGYTLFNLDDPDTPIDATIRKV